MRLSHDPLKISVRFDDPNLVSRAGLVPVMSLAERAGLGGLVRRYVQITAKTGVHPEVKVACLAAGMAVGADSIDDMDLLRHGALPDLFGGVRAPSTLGSFLRSFSWVMSASWKGRAGSCWRSWPTTRAGLGPYRWTDCATIVPRSAWTALICASVASAMIAPSAAAAGTRPIAAAGNRDTAMYSPSRWLVNSRRSQAR